MQPGKLGSTSQPCHRSQKLLYPFLELVRGVLDM
jgi:hypothetical protein